MGEGIDDLEASERTVADMNLRRVAAVAVGTAALLGAALTQVGPTGMSETAAVDALSRAGDRCFEGTSLSEGGETIECLTPVVNEISVALGPKRAMDTIVRLAAAEERWRYCHQVVHVVAHAAIEAGVGYPEIAGAAADDCNLGFIDGAVMAVAEANPDSIAAAEQVLQLCGHLPVTSKSVNECGHGFGHILWERHHGDPRVAIAACRSTFGILAGNPVISGERAEAQCVGGVAMSVVEGWAQSPERFPEGRPLGVCGLVEPGDLGYCVSFVVPFDAHLSDAEESLSWCRANARAVMGECGLAVGYHLANRGMSDTALSACDRFGVRDECRSSYQRTRASRSA